MARAVNSVCQGIAHAVILVSGDTAFAGKEVEYKYGRRMIEAVREGMAPAFNGAMIPVLSIAGNHDCDFGIATSVRTIVIDNLKPDKIDCAVIAQCTDVQQHYRTFADGFNQPRSGVVMTGLDHLHHQIIIDQGGKRIVFHLLNSAWVSQLHEKPGSLYFPVKQVRDRIANAPQADMVVAVVHHPFNWYSPENGRELRKCLEDNADLILTGHEHVQGAFGKKTDVGEQNEYLEGGVLQETGQPDASSFNLVIFDTAQGQQQTFRFVWKGDHYEPEGEPFWRPFERNSTNSQSVPVQRRLHQVARRSGSWVHSSAEGTPYTFGPVHIPRSQGQPQL